MNRQDIPHLHGELRERIDALGHQMHDLAEATGEQADVMRARARRSLRATRSGMTRIERGAAMRVRSAATHARDYVQGHPWLILGGFAVLMLAAGVLSHGRA